MQVQVERMSNVLCPRCSVSTEVLLKVFKAALNHLYESNSVLICLPFTVLSSIERELYFQSIIASQNVRILKTIDLHGTMYYLCCISDYCIVLTSIIIDKRSLFEGSLTTRENSVQRLIKRYIKISNNVIMCIHRVQEKQNVTQQFRIVPHNCGKETVERNQTDCITIKATKERNLQNRGFTILGKASNQKKHFHCLLV